MSYETETPIVDKFVNSSGSIQTLSGDIAESESDYNKKKYDQANPIPNKFLYADGSVKQNDGTVIESANDYGKQRYEQATPIPAKFLKPDGTITDKIGSGGGSSGYQKICIWGSSTSFYVTTDNPKVGDKTFYNNYRQGSSMKTVESVEINESGEKVVNGLDLYMSF